MSETTLVRQRPKRGQRRSAADMQARIAVLETELAAAHEREAAMVELLREHTAERDEALQRASATALRTLPLDGGGLRATTSEAPADPAQLVADLQRQLAECRAERDEALEYQTATSEVLNVISRSPFDLQPVLDALTETGARLCLGEQAYMTRREGDVFRFVTAGGSTPEATANAIRFKEEILDRRTFGPGRDTITGRVLSEGRAVQIIDAAADPEYKVSEIVTIAKARTLLAVPLLREGEPIGTFNLMRQRVQPFTARQIELVRTFADQAVIAIENARLLGELQARTRDLQESLEYQTATSEVLNVISRSTADVQPVLDTVAETACRLCGADVGAISIREGEVYRYVSAFALDAEYWPIRRQRTVVPGRETLAGRVLLEGRVVHVADILADPDYSWPENVASGRRTILGVPLLREGALIGTIGLARKRVEPFTERQIELVRTFADQAVIAIENARLLGELQQRTGDLQESLEYQTATSDVLKVISRSTFDLDPVLENVIETAIRLCRAHMGSIFRLDNGVYRWAVGIGLNPAYRELEKRTPIAPGSGTLVGRTAVERSPVQILDAMADPLYAVKEEASLTAAHTMLGVPLLREGVPIGVIAMARDRVEPFSEKEVGLVSTFADQAVIAIENIRLLTEQREALEQQTATAEVLRVISGSATDAQPVFEAITVRAAKLCEAEFSAVARFEDGLLRLVAVSNLLPDEARAFHSLFPRSPTRGFVMGRAFVEGRTVHVEDVLADPDYDPRTREVLQSLTGYRTFLGVPVLRDGKPIGVIGCARRAVRPFTAAQIELVSTFADQAVIAIENARLFNDLRDRTDELAQRQAELRVTFDNMADGVVMFDEELRLAAWNRNFQQIVDLPDDFLGAPQSYADYIRYLAMRGEFGDVDPEAEIERLRERFGDHYSFERGRPDGRVIEVRHNPVPSGGFVLIYSDITERKRSETEIRAARDAAEEASRTIAAAYQELKTAQARLIQAEKMASLGQLTAGIAHEIKNPLNFVNNFAGLSVELLDELKEAAAPALAALDGDNLADVDEIVAMLTGNLEKIAEHGRRADGIVKSMLEHSRGEGGERREIDLNTLVEEGLNLAYHGARAQDQSFNITLERDFADAIAPIELVPQDMTRALLNLVGNGFYAATKRLKDGAGPNFRPTLKVTTRDLGEGVEIRVRDNGVGIPPEIREKLFQPFFTTKPTGQGTGLGLSISYDIITQQHGGTVAVDSEVGAFTEFTIRLPRSRG